MCKSWNRSPSLRPWQASPLARSSVWDCGKCGEINATTRDNKTMEARDTWCSLLLLRVSNVVLGWVLHLSSSASNRPFIWSSVLLSSALIKVNKMHSPSIALIVVALALSVALYVGANQQYVKSTHIDEILAWVFGHISSFLPFFSSHFWPFDAKNI